MSRKELLIVILVLLVLFWNPMTRQIILFILPMGSGVDDLIFIVLAALALVFGIPYWKKKRRENREKS